MYYTGNPKGSIYSASKYAMEGFADGLRRELHTYNVSISIIEPGYVETSIHVKEDNSKVLTAAPEVVEEEVVSLYPQYYNDKYENKRRMVVSKSDDVGVTTNAIMHAMVSNRPYTRYAVANYNGTPALLIAYLVRLVPDRLADALFNMF